MTEVQHDSPESEGVARAAQRAAMSITVLKALARLRAQRIAEQAQDDERAASAARAQRLVDHASARVGWTPAHDDEWLRRATTGDLARAWAAATPWAATDADAHDAANRLERRLHELHPDAMAAYHHARAAGAEPAEAVQQAAPLFATTRAIELADPASTQRQPRPPRDIAADGYPFPTAAGVTNPHHPHTQVITTLPRRSRQTASR